MNRVCPRCGAGNQEQANHCIICGEALSAGAEPPKRNPTIPETIRAERPGTKPEGGPLIEPAPVPEGALVGNWIIEDRLGKGGMGVVYRGRHKDLDTQVAIKFLSPVLSQDPGFRNRFNQEAQTQARLRHPNIAHLQDKGEREGIIYMVIEYLEGGTLADKVQGSPSRLPLPDLLRWTREALAGLEYAHQQKIVHRDVTASNVMLDHRGVAKIADFGIAIVAGGKRLTGPEARPIGVPQYMSPEQITRPGEIDYRTDIYSMGIVLYELLTGRVPFESESDFETRRAQVTDPPPPPRSINPAIPEGLERIVLKAIEKQPNQRYSSCAEFSRALDDLESKLRPPSVNVTSPKPGDTWQAGSFQTIAWTANAAAGKTLTAIEIEVSKVKVAATGSTLAASLANAGSYRWQVPASLAVGEHRITITARDNQGNTAEALSPAFTIAPKPAAINNTVTPGKVSTGGGQRAAYSFPWIFLFIVLYNRMDLKDISKPDWHFKAALGAAFSWSLYSYQPSPSRVWPDLHFPPAKGLVNGLDPGSIKLPPVGTPGPNSLLDPSKIVLAPIKPATTYTIPSLQLNVVGQLRFFDSSLPGSGMAPGAFGFKFKGPPQSIRWDLDLKNDGLQSLQKFSLHADWVRTGGYGDKTMITGTTFDCVSPPPGQTQTYSRVVQMKDLWDPALGVVQHVRVDVYFQDTKIASGSFTMNDYSFLK